MAARRLAAWLTLLRAFAGIGDLAWEFGVDHLRHWPPTFILAVWLLGVPAEHLIRLLTSGRIQINVRSEEDKGEEGPPW